MSLVHSMGKDVMCTLLSTRTLEVLFVPQRDRGPRDCNVRHRPSSALGGKGGDVCTISTVSTPTVRAVSSTTAAIVFAISPELNWKVWLCDYSSCRNLKPGLMSSHKRITTEACLVAQSRLGTNYRTFYIFYSPNAYLYLIYKLVNNTYKPIEENNSLIISRGSMRISVLLFGAIQ